MLEEHNYSKELLFNLISYSRKKLFISMRKGAAPNIFSLLKKLTNFIINKHIINVFLNQFRQDVKYKQAESGHKYIKPQSSLVLLLQRSKN